MESGSIPCRTLPMLAVASPFFTAHYESMPRPMHASRSHHIVNEDEVVNLWQDPHWQCPNPSLKSSSQRFITGANMS
ncbi:hypothetical protein BMIN_0673 [Bifidobacterium minimum]|uniref:Uncharacterized protein n=1 Tax=Bifidobacterium minimum TaxID=1693 RepID=A0A087BPL2_9BIFI|nr:hypothetical protein BMIN_0673 [Bifidobacterium minimum]